LKNKIQLLLHLHLQDYVPFIITFQWHS